jgi:hypothetical protein
LEHRGELDYGQAFRLLEQRAGAIRLRDVGAASGDAGHYLGAGAAGHQDDIEALVPEPSASLGLVKPAVLGLGDPVELDGYLGRICRWQVNWQGRDGRKKNEKAAESKHHGKRDFRFSNLDFRLGIQWHNIVPIRTDRTSIGENRKSRIKNRNSPIVSLIRIVPVMEREPLETEDGRVED